MTDRHHPEPDVDIARYQRFARFARFIADQAPFSLEKLKRHGLAEWGRAEAADMDRLYSIFIDVQDEEGARIDRVLPLFGRYGVRTIEALAGVVTDAADQTVLRDWLDLDDEAEEAARRLGKRYDGMSLSDQRDDPDDDPHFWIACLRAGVLGPPQRK